MRRAAGLLGARYRHGMERSGWGGMLTVLATALALAAPALAQDGASYPDAPWVWPLSDTSLRATWTAHGSATTYQVRHCPTGTSDWTTTSVGSATTTTITDLSAGTVYEVQVAEVESDEEGGWSPSGSGRTLNGPGLGNLTYRAEEVDTAVSWIDTSNGVPNSTAVRYGTNVGAMVNGYFLTVFAPNGGKGPGGLLLYDVSNPREAEVAYTVHAPNGRTAEIREAHSIGVARVDGSTYVALQSTRGIEFWDLTDTDNIRQVSTLRLPGVHGGDYFGAAWQLFWQAPYVYVSASSLGFFVVDASNPARPYVARMDRQRDNPLPPGDFGGFKVGPVFAIGNQLVLASMHSIDGWASLDISNPLDPTLLDRTPDLSRYYSVCFNGDRLYSATRGVGSMVGYRLSDSGAFQRVSQTGTGNFLYCATQDDLLLQGGPHNFTKYDISNTGSPRRLGSVALDARQNREHGQVTLLGNLVYVGDDHGVGSALTPHSAAPDRTAPSVEAVYPRDGATNQSLTSRIGIGFSDSILFESVTSGTFRVIDDGGTVVLGTYSAQLGIVNFAPSEPLKPNSTYTVLLPENGVADYAGNAIISEFRSSFTTAASTSNIPSAVGISEDTRSASSTVSVASTFEAIAQADATYTWDFGDGSSSGPSMSTTTSHTYRSAGHHTVVLRVTTAGTGQTYSFVRTVARSRTATAPTTSSKIAGSGDLVFNVNPHNGSVTAIHRVGLNKEWETRVGRGPRTLALDASGRVWVAVGEEDKLVSLSAEGAVEGEIPVGYGSGPFGIAFVPGTNTGLVTLQYSGEVLRFDAASATVLGRRTVSPEPRGIAVAADGHAYVTHFRSTSAGIVSKINSRTLATVKRIELSVDSTTVDGEDRARGRPNYLTQVVVSPDGGTAWVTAKKDNVLRGERRDSRALTHETMVRAIASVIDLASGRELSGRRVDFNDRASPHAVAFSPLGDYVFVAMQGSDTVAIVDAYTGSHKGTMSAGGKAPQGIWIDGEGSQAFVYNFTTRSVSVHDIADVLANVSFEPALVHTIQTIASDVLDEQERLGLQIFYNASDPRMSRDGYLSCAGCHLEGGEDGAVWDFSDREEGFRNTISLHGRKGTAHGRMHWTANFDEIQDFENDIRAAFGGTGFLTDADFAQTSAPLGAKKAGLSRELDALAAYVTSLNDFGRSPYRTAAGKLTAAALRGRRLFARRGCNGCHIGSDFTDVRRHDVGTVGPNSGLSSGQPFAGSGIDTPTLIGVWRTAPYFHDGSAATLDGVLRSGHGEPGALSSSERDALVAYLRSLERPVNDFVQVRLQARDECWEAAPVTAAALGHPTCNAREPEQMWRLDPSGEIRPMLNDTLCLTAHSIRDTKLTLVTCSDSNEQKWRAEGGAFHSVRFPDHAVDTLNPPTSLAPGQDELTVRPSNRRGERQLWYLRYHGHEPAASEDAALLQLSLSNINLPFQREVLEYEVSVETDVEETTVEVKARDPGAEVEIMARGGSASSPSKPVSLSLGENEIEVEVVAENAQVARIYTVTVTRAAQTPVRSPPASSGGGGSPSGGGGSGGGGGGSGGGGSGGGGSGGGGSGGGGGGGGACTQDDVHGNSAATATAMALAVATAGAICPAADVDYFTVTAPGQGLLFVDTTGGVPARGTIWQNGVVLASGSTRGSGQDARLGARVQAGPVVVAIQGQGGATGPYEVEVTFTSGALENPGPASFQSGLGIISGWVCAADAVEIELNGMPQAAAYGTERRDTAAACGDTDNGFGLLFNWNLLGDGEHEVVAFVDGVELGRATVTVTTLGAEFVRGVTGTCEAPAFPLMGEAVTLEWQQTQQNFVLVDGARPRGPTRAGNADVGYLENPGPDSFQSGIGVISGWVCEGDTVEIQIGTAGRQGAAYGTERRDTESACGDTDNGFGLLFNWNLLGDGEHEVVAFVDDIELGRAAVRVTTLGEEFLRGVEGECVVEDFPGLAQTVTLEWHQNSQNFVITAVE